jgi:phosphate transport system permease protein
VLISPTLILFFSDAFARVPTAWLRAAEALGCSRIQTFFHVILPRSLKGLASGVVLALGRALGDTLIGLMLAGNAVGMPHSPLDPARTLTAHIALLMAADFESLEFRIIFACGLLLYLVSLGLTLLVRSLDRGREGLR